MKKVLILLLLSVFVGGIFADEIMHPTGPDKSLTSPRNDAQTPVKQPLVQENVSTKPTSTFRDGPNYEFIVDPTTIGNSFYDYMPCAYNSWGVRIQPEFSQPWGLPANGIYIAFHAMETSTAERRVYYAYVTEDGVVANVDPISTTDVRQGYAGIDIDPVTADPFVAWHAIVEPDNSYDVLASYDLYHMMGSPGLWIDEFILFDNPEVSEPLTGWATDEFIWPKVMIGPSPEADHRRIYAYGDNYTSSAGAANYNVLLGYADFETADLDAQSTFEWTYQTFPLMDQYQYQAIDRTIKDMAISDDGQVAMFGWAGDSLCVWYSDNYAEDFTYYSQYWRYDIDNQQNLDGTWWLINDDGSPAEPYLNPSPDGGHFNAIFTENNTKIRCFTAMGLTTVEAAAGGSYYPFYFYPKVYTFDIATGEFSLWDMYLEGASPGDDFPYIPYDIDGDDVMEVDEYDEDGNIVFVASWPTYFYAGDLQDGSFHNSTFKLTENENWVIALWQDGYNQFQGYDGVAGYEDWFEVSEIAIAVSGDYGATWSQPRFLNAKTDDVNYCPELDNMMPCFVYPGDTIEVLDDYHGKLHMVFFDDASFGPYAIDPPYGTNSGGELQYCSLSLEFSVPWIPPMSTDDYVIPAVGFLAQNYPNPFNPSTTIKYEIKEAGNVSIEVFNIMGQKVKTLVNEYHTANNYSLVWDGTNNKNEGVSSGVYFYKMQAGRYTSTKKMILMKQASPIKYAYPSHFMGQAHFTGQVLMK